MYCFTCTTVLHRWCSKVQKIHRGLKFVWEYRLPKDYSYSDHYLNYCKQNRITAFALFQGEGNGEGKGAVTLFRSRDFFFSKCLHIETKNKQVIACNCSEASLFLFSELCTEIGLHFYFQELILSKLCLFIFQCFSQSPGHTCFTKSIQYLALFSQDWDLFTFWLLFVHVGIWFLWLVCLFLFETKMFSVCNIFNILCSSELFNTCWKRLISSCFLSGSLFTHLSFLHEGPLIFAVCFVCLRM